MNTEQEQATIFLVEEDDETRPFLKQNLQRDGYRIAIALDEEDALADGPNRARGQQIGFGYLERRAHDALTTAPGPEGRPVS